MLPQRPLLLSHSPALAGAERWLLDVAEIMREAGAKPTLVVPAQGLLSRQCTVRGLPWVQLSLPWWAATSRRGVLKDWGSSPKQVVAAGHLVAYAARANSDCILTNTSVTGGGATVAYTLRIPHIWAIHELREHYRFSYGQSLLRTALGAADHVILNSQATESSWRPMLGAARRSVLYQPVSPGESRWTQPPSDAPIRLLTLTSIDPVKEIHTSIDVLSEIHALGIDAELRLVGPIASGYAPQLLERAGRWGLSHRVQIVGPAKDVSQELASAHILLHPSPQESYGRVLMEAMLVGVPVIARRAGAAAEIIGEAGKLFDAPKEAADFAREILSNRDISREL
ncbi:MAG: glycosyltransferase family 4 protein, partial [Myxococcota bacterium]